MEWLFGKQKTPKEIMRENQRLLQKSMREIDRERTSLQNQEKKIIIEIKKLAKQNQMGAAKIMAKDLVRTRNQVQKFYKMRAELQAVSLRIQTLHSTASMADAMKGVTKAMIRMNRSMNLPAMQAIIMEFERQSEMMDMKEEMMNDAIDGMYDEDEDEKESDQIVNEVLDEIGIDLTEKLADTPNTKSEAQKEAPAKEAPMADVADADLQARLDNLRK